MSNAVKIIKGNKQHTLSLLKNQISISVSTFKIVKQDETVTANELTDINHELSEISTHILGIEENAHQERLFRTLAELVMRLTLRYTEYVVLVLALIVCVVRKIHRRARVEPPTPLPRTMNLAQQPINDFFLMLYRKNR
uniref:Uncharacterized protein n=1 Tax=Glossina palpalis gambiensis TaxID=67801 RepID=A0A1B0C520_9MUSC